MRLPPALALGLLLPACGGGSGPSADGGPGVDGGGPDDSVAVDSVTAGGDYTCAILETGALKCWGWSGEGELGLGDVRTRGDEPGEMGNALPAVDLGTGRSAKHIAAGTNHTCAILDDDKLKCWGTGYGGKLGLGSTEVRGDEAGEMGDALPTVDLGTGVTPTMIATGGEHTCVLLDGGHLKCWGDGQEGELGQGNMLPVGDGPGQMGDSLPEIDLGTGATAAQVVTGSAFTCALLAGGAVKCWGGNEHGQLGLGDVQNRGDEPGEMGDALPTVDVDPGHGVIAITAGRDHACALLDDSSVKCWGSNDHGQLGLGDTEARGDEPGEMGAALPRVDLGTGPVVAAIAAGKARTCALMSNGTIKCWGWGEAGALGHGAQTDLGTVPGEMGDALPAVNLGTGIKAAALVVGGFHNCARLENGALKCWGSNGRGELGLGDIGDRGEQVGDMGDALPAVRLGTVEP